MTLSVLVVQMGARRGYELARMLDGRGILAALQTSAGWVDGQQPSRVVSALIGQDTGRVQRRTVRGIARQKVRTTLVPEIVDVLGKRVGISRERLYRIEDAVLGSFAWLNGLGGANIVLNTGGNGGAFLNWAKRQGARIVTDVVITPAVYDILDAEREAWPGWEPAVDHGSDARIYRRNLERTVQVSDLLLSPSDVVDDGLATVKGFQRERLARVPYGLGAAKIKAGSPEPKRVLFAGTAGLRKGLPYLAEAARILTPLGYRFRVAGGASEAVRARSECRDLEFLGHLGPKAMAEEFRLADIFCLPSLAEGMASVTLEALAAGLPCVVTRSSGAPVRHGRDGMIVPERDGPGIADALREISEDRGRRAALSAAALQTAKDHELSEIAARLHSELERAVMDGR